MPKMFEFDVEHQRIFDEWRAERPPKIQKMVDRYPPNVLFRLKTTGQRGLINSWSEDGTVSIGFPPELNPNGRGGKMVWGIKTVLLEECELPTLMDALDMGDSSLEAPCSCFDCKVDTLKINEFYMVLVRIWKQAKLPPTAKYLCIGCLEKRIGRMLRKRDFTDAPINWASEDGHSDRLRDRLTRVK